MTNVSAPILSDLTQDRDGEGEELACKAMGLDESTDHKTTAVCHPKVTAKN